MPCAGGGDGCGRRPAACPCVLSEGWRLPARGMADTPVSRPASLTYVCEMLGTLCSDGPGYKRCRGEADRCLDGWGLLLLGGARTSTQALRN